MYPIGYNWSSLSSICTQLFFLTTGSDDQQAYHQMLVGGLTGVVAAQSQQLLIDSPRGLPLHSPMLIP